MQAYCRLDQSWSLRGGKQGLGAASGCPAWSPSPRASVPCANRAALPRRALFLAPAHLPSSVPPQSDAAWLSVGKEGGNVGAVLAAPLLRGAVLRLPPPFAASPDGSEGRGAGRRALCSPGTHPSLPRGVRGIRAPDAGMLPRLGHGRAVPPRCNCTVLKCRRVHLAAGASGILPPDNAATAEGLSIGWTLGRWKYNL